MEFKEYKKWNDYLWKLVRVGRLCVKALSAKDVEAINRVLGEIEPPELEFFSLRFEMIQNYISLNTNKDIYFNVIRKEIQLQKETAETSKEHYEKILQEAEPTLRKELDVDDFYDAIFNDLFGRVADRHKQIENIIEYFENPVAQKEEIEIIEEEINQAVSSKVLTLKQKIILLETLGFFELEKVAGLTTLGKGSLVSSILGSSFKNTTDKLTYLNPPNIEQLDVRHRVKTVENLEKVNELLKELKLIKL